MHRSHNILAHFIPGPCGLVGPEGLLDCPPMRLGAARPAGGAGRLVEFGRGAKHWPGWPGPQGLGFGPGFDLGLDFRAEGKEFQLAGFVRKQLVQFRAEILEQPGKVGARGRRPRPGGWPLDWGAAFTTLASLAFFVELVGFVGEIVRCPLTGDEHAGVGVVHREETLPDGLEGDFPGLGIAGPGGGVGLASKRADLIDCGGEQSLELFGGLEELVKAGLGDGHDRAPDWGGGRAQAEWNAAGGPLCCGGRAGGAVDGRGDWQSESHGMSLWPVNLLCDGNVGPSYSTRLVGWPG